MAVGKDGIGGGNPWEGMRVRSELKLKRRFTRARPVRTRLYPKCLARNAPAVRPEPQPRQDAPQGFVREPALAEAGVQSRGHPERAPLPADRQQELDCLATEYDALIEERGGDPESEIAAQLQALSEKIEKLTEG